MTDYVTDCRYCLGMMSTIVLLGIYYVSVAAVYGLARFKPWALRRLNPIVIVGLFSFVPALTLGRQMLLRTRLWETFTAIPDWVLFGLSGLFVLGAFPVRNWIRKHVLERSANAARRFLDKLPERVMSTEAAESRGDISLEEATERKIRIQRDADRLAAVDGVGRFLYLLPELPVTVIPTLI